MLILSRKRGEVIVIGEETRVMVTGIDGSSVRIGVDAPSYILVNREEVHQRLKHEKKLLTNQEENQ